MQNIGQHNVALESLILDEEYVEKLVHVRFAYTTLTSCDIDPNILPVLRVK